MNTPCDDLKADIADLEKQIAKKEKTGAFAPVPLPSGAPLGIVATAPSAALAAAAVAPPLRVEERFSVKAAKDMKRAHFAFPNKSYGKFIAQVTVCTPALTGLVDGESLGFLEFRQPRATGGPRRFFIGACYDATANGLRALVSNVEQTQEFGTAIPFPLKYEIDLRIEQTDTQLIFSARETPADQSAGGWTAVHTEALALDPEFFHVYIGMRNVRKGGKFAFTHFAMDGDAIGGMREYPVIAKVREAVDALRAAQTKLREAAPDLTAAVGDLDVALEKNEEAITSLQTQRYQMQSPAYANVALGTLAEVRASLMKAIATVETQNVTKAKTQVAKLDSVATNQTEAMGNLLGWRFLNMKVAPTVFALRIP